MIGTYVFPSQNLAAFAAIYVSDGMIPCGHLSVVRFTLDDIYAAPINRNRHNGTGAWGLHSHSVEQIRPTMLAIERLMGFSTDEYAQREAPRATHTRDH